MAIHLTQDQLATFQRDGFIVVRGVFSQDEVQRIRDGAYAEAAEAGMRRDDRTGKGFALPGDVGSHPALCHLIADERVVSIARQLLGEQPVHFRDSAVGIGGLERGWHKDNRTHDRHDATAPDWDGDYPMIRMGIYCQDHVDHSGGLALRVGSHLPGETRRQRFAKARWGLVRRFRNGTFIRTLATGMLAKGRPVHVDSRAGDLVAWNMRITHSGLTQRPRVAPKLKLPPFMESRLPRALFKPEPCERIAVFLTYGADSPHLTRFVEWVKARSYFPPRTRDRELCDEVVAAADAAGLVVRDPWLDPVFAEV